MTEEQKIAFSKNTEIVETIKEGVAIYFGVDMEVMNTLNNNQKKLNVKLKQFVAYITKKLAPQIGLEFIGRSMGGFNHATILFAKNQAANFIDTDKEYRLQMNEVLTILTGDDKYGSEFKKVLAGLHFYVDLNEINILRVSPAQAIIFSGVNQNIIERIRSEYFNSDKLEIENLKNTGLSIMTKRNKLTR